MPDDTSALLPDEFADLERLLPWALPTTRERQDRRHASSMEEIQDLYDSLIPRMTEILEALGQYPDEQQAPEPMRRLFHLACALAEVATCVEWFGQPSVIQGFDYRRYTLVEG